MPLNPSVIDSCVRIEALVDFFKINRELSKLKQYQAVLKVLIKQANVLIQKENKRKDAHPIAKLKDIDDVCIFINFHKVAVKNVINMLMPKNKTKVYIPVTQIKLLELSYIIPKLANKLKIPAFMPVNFYTIMYKNTRETKNFIQYRDILYLRKVCKMTYNEAIKKYLADNKIFYNIDEQQKIDNVKRTLRKYKTDNTHLKKYYSKEFTEKIFNILKEIGCIPPEVQFNEKYIDYVAEIAIIKSAEKKSYDDYVKYGKKNLKQKRNIEILNAIQSYCYNAFRAIE